MVISVMLLPFLITGAVLAAVLVTLANKQKQLKAHQAQMASWAAANGLTYLSEDRLLPSRWAGKPFVGGSQSTAFDVLTGRLPSGQQFCSFGYRYVVSTGETTQTVLVWVLVLRMPRTLPWLTVTPEGLGNRLTKAFGSQDIELESDEFNKAFRVESGAPAFAFAILSPRVMEWLLGPGRSIVPWRMVGSDIMCWRAGLPNYQFMWPLLQDLAGLVQQVPLFVWDDYGLATPRMRNA